MQVIGGPRSVHRLVRSPATPGLAADTNVSPRSRARRPRAIRGRRSRAPAARRPDDERASERRRDDLGAADQTHVGREHPAVQRRRRAPVDERARGDVLDAVAGAGDRRTSPPRDERGRCGARTSAAPPATRAAEDPDRCALCGDLGVQSARRSPCRPSTSRRARHTRSRVGGRVLREEHLGDVVGRREQHDPGHSDEDEQQEPVACDVGEAGARPVVLGLVGGLGIRRMLIPSVPIASTRNVTRRSAAAPLCRCDVRPCRRPAGPRSTPHTSRSRSSRSSSTSRLRRRARDQREDRGPGDARERAEREREEEHEGHAHGERQCSRDDRLHERAPTEGLDRLAPIGQPTGERREQHVGERRHDEEQRHHPG